MSERELRERLLQPAPHTYGQVCAFCGEQSLSGPVVVHAARCPMDDAPDVVKVLRAMQQLMDDAQTHKPNESFEMVFPTIFVHEMIERLQTDFHVRPTDDGYEWVDA